MRVEAASHCAEGRRQSKCHDEGGWFPFFITIRRHPSTHPLRLAALPSFTEFIRSAEAINAKYILIQYRDLESLS